MIVTLPDNVNQWNPGRHTEPFCGGNSDDYRVSETEKEKKNHDPLQRNHMYKPSIGHPPTCVLTLLRRSGYESKAPIATANNRCTMMSEYLQ